MEQNMTISVGFKGGAELNAIPIYNHDGAPLTKGGLIDVTNTEVAYFGRVVSEDPASLDQFLMGCDDGDTVVGVLQNDFAITENDPAKPDYLLNGMPATAIFFGPMWIMNWTHDATGALTTPTIGCKVIFKKTTGQIEFLAADAVIPTGYSLLNASVKGYVANINKVLLFMGLSDIERDQPVPTATAKMRYFAIVDTGVTGFTALGQIIESTGAIAVTVPSGTTVTALKAQFDFDGSTIKIGSTAQVSGVTANNFTSPVTYRITAQDGTTKDYVVTVTVHS